MPSSSRDTSQSRSAFAGSRAYGATVPLSLVSSQTFSTGVVHLVYGPAADAS